ncbi:MAG: CRISPR-associated endonuclease Cas2 [candidate division WOR-3 bacterium]
MSPSTSDSWFLVVSYDVRDDRRRAKVLRTMKDFGERVQYSVFECRLDDKEYALMSRRLARLIDVKADSVRVYRLCEGCLKRIEFVGLGRIAEDEEVYVV